MYYYLKQKKNETLKEHISKNLVSAITELKKSNEAVYAVEFVCNNQYHDPDGALLAKSSYYKISIRTLNFLQKISKAHFNELLTLQTESIPISSVPIEYLFEKIKEVDPCWVDIGPACKDPLTYSLRSSALTHIFINPVLCFNLSEESEKFFKDTSRKVISFKPYLMVGSECFRNISIYNDISINRTEAIEMDFISPYKMLSRNIQIQGCLNLINFLKEFEKTSTGKYKTKCKKEINICEEVIKSLFEKTDLTVSFLNYTVKNIEKINKNIEVSKKKLNTVSNTYEILNEKVENLPEIDRLLIELL